jgi:hypothetical protein
MINIGIGVAWAKSLYSVANNIIANFRARVLSYPNSIFEAGPCLDATLEELNAIGLLDDASLIVTPNAYNEGVLYDVIPNTPLGDMDVVRATTATRVNSAGLIEVVPRNLITYSNDFTNATWVSVLNTITANYAISPDGTQNATRLQSIKSNSSEDSYLINVSKDLAGGCKSIYIKGVSIGGSMILGDSTITFTTEWQRYSITSDYPFVLVGARTGFNNIDVLIYGAQLEAFPTATEYFPTTTRLNIPRIDYTNGSCPSLLVEPQRTNNLLYSSSFDNAAWDKQGATVTANNTTAPDGTMSADRVVFSGANKTIRQALNMAGATITASVYIKGTAGQTIGIDDIFAIQQIVTLTGEWQRLQFTAASPNGYGLGISTFGGVTATTIYLWGAQLEVGSYPTSYIPTVASTVTRNADIISKTGISSLIGQTEGTMFVDVNLTHSNKGVNEYLMQVWLDPSNRILIFRNTSNFLGYYFIKPGGTFNFDSSISANGRHKIAFAYKNGSNAFYIDGTQIEVNSSAVTAFSSLSNFDLGINKSIGTEVENGDYAYNSAQLYKTRLSNEQLTLLTGDLYDSYAEMANSLNYILE